MNVVHIVASILFINNGLNHLSYENSDDEIMKIHPFTHDHQMECIVMLSPSFLHDI